MQESDPHCQFGKHETTEEKEGHDDWQELNKILVNTHRVVKLDPTLVVKFFGVATISSIREATGGRFTVGETLLVFCFELFHKFGVEVLHSRWNYDCKTDYHAFEANQNY